MPSKTILLAAICLLQAKYASAQSVNNVTEIITDFGGFFQSSTTAINPVKPDNSHDLLAFTLSGTRYSTGVDDALLTARGLTFVAGQYKGLPVESLGTITDPNTKVGLGASYDGVPNGASSPPPSNNIPFYLRDGRNGLNLGTGTANAPAGTLTFTISQVVPAAAADGIPDILVTQFADPSSAQDRYQFLDANGQVVGNTVAVTFTNIGVVANWTADFYEASKNPMTLTSGFTRTDRPLRLWSADLSAFGITAANASAIRGFQVLLSGSSDIAFVAYNAQAATFFNPPLPVELTAFGGEAATTQTTLTWQTAQEVNSAAFEVQASTDGRTFRTVGRVQAAGTSSQRRQYSYQHPTTQAGVRYYRLLQIDQDGTSTTSPVLALTAGRKTGQPLQVTAAPNPFGSQLVLTVAGAEAGQPTTVELLTLAGRRVHQQAFPASAGQLLTLELAQLPAGMYLARVAVAGQSAVLKVVKQ
ncbi:T9SS type A sorting domain-containing protein [Hymenobacter yonginensis]|uniref:T9SS type A sorting domain-containing protein n=1 Tax=Hymenobacter yonginensis TaxID=748197 RepID=A0ABY7PSK9_9BACT|nr:T9SS type A sorting domain-containing protein [Hymenobacter yonginensis]WBO85871.1 T9SS type A sorting domain-containing protein [Hymenobacter yonginensis]